MLISELIIELQKMKEKHGDIPVFCQQSQDPYYEYHEVGYLTYGDSTSLNEIGIYIESDN